MPNLTVLLLAVAIALGVGATTGYRYKAGQVAQAQTDALLAVAEAARKDAALESTEALAVAERQAKARRVVDRKQHELELELAKDEAARNCRVGDATLGLLNSAIRSANAPASDTGAVDAAVPATR